MSIGCFSFEDFSTVELKWRGLSIFLGWTERALCSARKSTRLFRSSRKMFRFTKWIAAPVVAIGMFFAADTPNANAQGFSLSINSGRGFGYSAYRPSFGYGGYGAGYGLDSCRSNFVVVPPHQSHYGSGYQSHYRGGHYDYHPTEVYRHGNHYDVVPGHYDYHHGSHFGHH
jgi:hypothetical protein